MIDPGSRYASVGETTAAAPGGRPVRCLRRRFIPAPAADAGGGVVVGQGDRLDLIAARALGDPEQYWRLCDANRAMHPAELTAVAGRRLHVPLPQPG